MKPIRFALGLGLALAAAPALGTEPWERAWMRPEGCGGDAIAAPSPGSIRSHRYR